MWPVVCLLMSLDDRAATMFTDEETEALGDFVKNTKLVRVTPPKGDQEWVFFGHSLPVQASCPP